MINNTPSRYLPTPLLVLVAGICLVSAIHHFPKPNQITYDVYGYYVYLPAAITFGDLQEFKFVESHFEQYPMNSGIYQVTQVGDRRVPIYTMGLAVMISPFYVLGEMMSAISGSPRDGLSWWYQFSFWLSSIFYSLMGLLFLWKWLRNKFDHWTVLITLTTITIGTNYFFYVALENGLTHAYIFSLYAVLLYASERWVNHRSKSNALCIGGLIALLCLIRPSELIALCLPIGYLIFEKGWEALLPRWKDFLIMVAVGLLVVLPQMLLWKTNTGQWIFNAYMEQGHAFHLSKPHLSDGLFSYRKGWLLYTPVMILALVGFAMKRMRQKAWFWPILLYTALHIWITFSWSMWWYASSFGSRPMVHAYAALSLPLAYLIESWHKFKFIRNAILLGLIALNLFQSWQIIEKIIPWDGINRIYYWKTFGKTNRDATLIKYVDLNTALPGIDKYKRERIDQLNWNQFVTPDSSIVIQDIQGKLAEQILPTRVFSYPLVHNWENGGVASDVKWLNISAELFRKGDAFDAYRIAQLGVSFHQNDQKVYEDGIRFPFFLEENEWGTAEFEVPIPEDFQKGSQIRVFVWNPSPDTIFVHNLEIDALIKPNR